MVQFQHQYETLQTSAFVASATSAIISAATRQSGPSRMQVPLTIVIDGVAASGVGTAGFVTLSASGTVLDRIGFAANDTNPHIPIHLEGGVGDAISMFASGSAGSITVNFHRK